MLEPLSQVYIIVNLIVKIKKWKAWIQLIDLIFKLKALIHDLILLLAFYLM